MSGNIQQIRRMVRASLGSKTARRQGVKSQGRVSPRVRLAQKMKERYTVK